MINKRQSAGVISMMAAWALAVWGVPPWSWIVAGVLAVLGLFVAVRRFAALTLAWCLCSLGLYLAAPFLWMWAPDYFASERFDTIFFVGCVAGSIVLLIIQYEVIPVLWPKVYRYLVVGGPTLEDIAPHKGKTVAELRQNGVEPPQVNFLFGRADQALVEQWGGIARQIALFSKNRLRMAIWLACVLLLWPVAVFFVSGGTQAAFERDVDRLWLTQTTDNGLVVTSPQAMNAARRVFKNDRMFRNLTKEEVRKLLHTERKNKDFLLGNPRWNHEKDETVAVVSDGKHSIRLVAVYNDQGKIYKSWPEEYYTNLARDLKQPEA